MKATKIHSGWYRVGRFNIERSESEWLGRVEITWNIIDEDGEWCETLSTLRECKEWIKERSE